MGLDECGKVRSYCLNTYLGALKFIGYTGQASKSTKEKDTEKRRVREKGLQQ